MDKDTDKLELELRTRTRVNAQLSRLVGKSLMTFTYGYLSNRLRDDGSLKDPLDAVQVLEAFIKELRSQAQTELFAYEGSQPSGTRVERHSRSDIGPDIDSE